MSDLSLDLFQTGSFRAHSGADLAFKIECDALAESELNLFAQLIVTKLWTRAIFGHVVGVPKGQPTGRDNGGVLAQYVRRHLRSLSRIRRGVDRTLIVDDVLTTGMSMMATRASRDVDESVCFGAVIFARGPCPDWVRPLFTLNKRCW